MVSLSKHQKSIKDRVSYKDYKRVLDIAMDKICTAIVENNAKLAIPYLGSLGISKEKNKFKRKSVNTAESLKNRNKILERGKIPLKYEKDEQGNIVGDNGGEEWLVYYCNPIICAWRIDGKRFTVLDNSSYTFKASRPNSKKLYEFIQSNTLGETFYGTNN